MRKVIHIVRMWPTAEDPQHGGFIVSHVRALADHAEQRILIWDMPLLGIDQASLRFLSGFWLPSLAGLLAGWLFGKQQATSLK